MIPPTAILLLTLAAAGAPSSGLPPLECRDAAGRVLAAAASPRRFGGPVTRPEVVKRVQPDFAKILGDARVQGVIVIESIIDRRGTVCAARLVGSARGELAETALAALRRWQFKPATLNGKPVPVFYTLTLNIDLR